MFDFDPLLKKHTCATKNAPFETVERIAMEISSSAVYSTRQSQSCCYEIHMYGSLVTTCNQKLLTPARTAVPVWHKLRLQPLHHTVAGPTADLATAVGHSGNPYVC